MEIMPLNKIPLGKSKIKDRYRMLDLTSEDNVKIADVTDMKFYDNPYFIDRYHKFFERTKKKESRLKKGSLIYNNLMRAIILSYIKTLIKIIVNEIVNGNKIIYSSTFSFMVSSMRTDRRLVKKLKYKYIHEYKGQFPLLRIGTFRYFLIQKSKEHNCSLMAMYISGFLGNITNRMVAHKIIKENIKYSKEWQPILEIKSKWINYKS